MRSIEALENWYNTQSPRTKAYEYEHHYRLIKKRFRSIRDIERIFNTTYFRRIMCRRKRSVGVVRWKRLKIERISKGDDFYGKIFG